MYIAGTELKFKPVYPEPNKTVLVIVCTIYNIGIQLIVLIIPRGLHGWRVQ